MDRPLLSDEMRARASALGKTEAMVTKLMEHKLATEEALTPTETLLYAIYTELRAQRR